MFLTWWREHAVGLVRWATLAGLVVAAVVYVLGKTTIPQLLTLLALALMAFLVWTVKASDIRGLLARIQKVSVGGVSLELQAGVQAAAVMPKGSEDDAEPDATTVAELRFRLERKLTYLAKHVLAGTTSDGRPIPTCFSIGSLQYDGLLSRTEAILADTILTTSENEFRLLPDSQRAELLEVGGIFVKNVRAAIFHAYVAGIVGKGKTLERVRRVVWRAMISL